MTVQAVVANELARGFRQRLSCGCRAAGSHKLVGDWEAQAALGELFELGVGVARDYRTAAQWYAQAARQEHAGAMVSLGNLYERGQADLLLFCPHASPATDKVGYNSTAATRARRRAVKQYRKRELGFHT